MRLGVVINQKAAQAQSLEVKSEIHDLFAAKGIHPSFIALERMAALNREHFRVDALIAAGGDGTLNAVAGSALKQKLPVGVLPLGTRNHFARDLSLPLSLPEAVQVIANGRTSAIDVGEVNGRPFVNNSSIGAYPRAVEQRENLRRKYRVPKMLAMSFALLQVFAESRLLWATMQLDSERIQVVSPFIFIGNNQYDLKGPGGPFRSSLSEGTLSVFSGECHGLADFFHMLWLSLRGRVEQSGLLHAYSATGATISLKRPHVRVSTDGEIWRAETPLNYLIRPAALEVFVP